MRSDTKLAKLATKWSNGTASSVAAPDHVVQDMNYLIGRVNELEHQLDMHFENDTTGDCPGCYMEVIWEKQIEEVQKKLKVARKSFREADRENLGLSGIVCNLSKLHKTLLNSSSSQAFFFMQQAYGTDLEWDEVKNLMEEHAKWCRGKLSKKLKKHLDLLQG